MKRANQLQHVGVFFGLVVCFFFAHSRAGAKLIKRVLNQSELLGRFPAAFHAALGGQAVGLYLISDINTWGCRDGPAAIRHLLPPCKALAMCGFAVQLAG